MTEFAYVTDGACGVANILDVELVICKVSNLVRMDLVRKHVRMSQCVCVCHGGAVVRAPSLAPGVC